jgi:chorismate mutase/prephenate dehydratase
MTKPRSSNPDPAWRAEGGDAEATRALEELRQEIDRIDREILVLLNRRAAQVKEVGAVKRGERSTIYRAGRERDLIQALVAENDGLFPSDAIPAVFREIVSGTRSLEARLRIAYLGPEGTFSHLAAREAFGAQADYQPVATLGDVVAAVGRGDADHGLLPVENTSEGVVTQSLDALQEADVPLCGERLLRISHQLLSRSGQLEDVRRVASHPQPLAQCRGWLDRHLPEAARVETTSTVTAAALAAEDPEVAAIASSLVAESSGLATVAAGIEDRRDNTTRFLVLGGEPSEPTGNDLTSLIFTVRKGESGALYRLLEPFARHGVNLTSIQARPLKGTPWEYVFYFDLEGHPSEERVARACEEAAKLANSGRVLGAFPRAIQNRVGSEGTPS